MEITIEYWNKWNYQPQAASLADELKSELGVESTLIPGVGGIFEVIADGKVIYEKAKTGKFPDKGEVSKLLK